MRVLKLVSRWVAVLLTLCEVLAISVIRLLRLKSGSATMGLAVRSWELRGRAVLGVCLFLNRN